MAIEPESEMEFNKAPAEGYHVIVYPAVDIKDQSVLWSPSYRKYFIHVTGFGNIKKNDIVYIFLQPSAPGIHGWGLVLDEPSNDYGLDSTFSGSDPFAPLEYHPFNNGIISKKLFNQYPELTSEKFNPRDGKLTVEQVNLLNSLIKSGGYEPPPNPKVEGLGLGMTAEAEVIREGNEDLGKTAEEWNQLGSDYLEKGGYDKAIEYYEKALASDLKALGSDHPKVARDWHHLGDAWKDKGKYDHAIEYYEKALYSDLKTSGPNHPDVARDWNSLGSAWQAKGEYDKAIEHYDKALASDLKTFGPGHSRVATRWNNLGEAWRRKGEYDKAIAYLDKALDSDLKTLGPDHSVVALDWNNLGSAWQAKGEYDKAIEYYDKALASDLKTFGSEHPEVAIRWNNLGSAWQAKGEYDKALEYYEKALAINFKTHGKDHPNVAINWNNLGVVWQTKGEYDMAIEYYEKALASDLKTFGSDHHNLAVRWSNLGGAWQAKGETDKAIEYFEKALASDFKTFGPDHPNVAQAHENLKSAWEKKGAPEKAKEFFDNLLMKLNVGQTTPESISVTPEPAVVNVGASVSVKESIVTILNFKDTETGFVSDDSGSEDPAKKDKIGIQGEVKAFAKLAAGREIVPPLSIAIFGDWGTGKSFFMNSVKKKIQEIADAVKKQNTEELSYCQHIVQIEFNAWHYVESNLWASLVDHMFVELDKALTERTNKETVKNLIEELETSQELKEEAVRERRQAHQQCGRARTKLTAARNSYNEQHNKLSKLRVEDVWSMASKEWKDKLKDSDFKSKIEEIETTLGWKGLTQSAYDMQKVIEETQSVAGRSKMIYSSIASRPGGWVRFGLLAGIILGAPLIGYQVVEWLTGSGESTLAELGKFTSSVATLLAGVAGWVITNASKVHKVLDFISEAKSKLDKSLEAGNEQHAKGLAEKENQLKEEENKVRGAEQRLIEAQKAVMAAEKAVKESTAIHRLRSFIQDRVTNDDYAKHLGIISKIRKDFETMSKLMSKIKEEKKDKNLDAIMNMNINEGEGSEKKQTKPIPYLDRIILYIDDLDRCPPERVVEVLQAVHLLLNFKLFVVFVAVDARWVSHSLRVRYPQQFYEIALPEGKAAESDESDHKEQMKKSIGFNKYYKASTEDYLEKIFQIPFWVRSMGEQENKNLLTGLFESARTKKQEEPSDKDLPPVGEGMTPSEKDSIAESGKIETKIKMEQVPEELGTGKSNENDKVSAGSGNGEKQSNPTDLEKKTEEEKDKHPIDLDPEPMTLGDDEFKLMEELAPYVGRSPRQVKRFGNIYRVIKGGMSPDLTRTLNSDGYKMVLVFLGMITGAPTIAPRILQKLLNQKTNIKKKIFIEQFKKDYPATDLEEMRKIEELFSFLEVDSIPLKDIKGEVNPCKRWIRLIQRYSFRSPAE